LPYRLLQGKILSDRKVGNYGHQGSAPVKAARRESVGEASGRSGARRQTGWANNRILVPRFADMNDPERIKAAIESERRRSVLEALMKKREEVAGGAERPADRRAPEPGR